MIWFDTTLSTYVLYLFPLKIFFSITLQGRIAHPNCRLEESDDRDGIPGPLYGEEGEGCEEYDRISF
jgi:hypothetical protein